MTIERRTAFRFLRRNVKPGFEKARSLLPPLHSLVCLAVFAVALGACGKGEDEAGGAPEDRLQMLRQSPFLSLSSEANQIFGIDMKRLRGSSMYSGLNAVIYGEEGVRKERWEEITRELGYDPWTKIDQMVLGFYRIFDLDDPWEHCMVIFTGTWSSEMELMEAFHAYASTEFMLEEAPFFKGEYRGYPVYTAQAPSRINPGEMFQMSFAFPTQGMAIFSRAYYLVPESIDVIENAKQGIQESEKWTALLEPVQLDSLVWGAGTVPLTVNRYISRRVENDPELKLLMHLPQAEQFFVNVHLNDEFRIRGGLIMPSPGLARGMATDLKNGRIFFLKLAQEQFGARSPKVDAWMKIYDQILPSSLGNTANFTFRLPRADVENLLQISTWEPTPTPTPLVIPPPFRQQSP